MLACQEVGTVSAGFLGSDRFRCRAGLEQMGSTYSIPADGHHWGDWLRLVEPGDPSETLLCLVSHRHRAGGGWRAAPQLLACPAPVVFMVRWWSLLGRVGGRTF